MSSRPITRSEASQILHRRAQSIARVLDIPAATFTGRDRQAYLIMSHLAAMPSIIDKGRRHRYGNEILLNANSLMPDSQPHNKQFNAQLRMHVALMQEMPAWYSALTKSNIAIVNDYLNLKLITWGMEMAGLGSLGVAGMSGDAVKGGVAAARGATGVRQGLASGARGAMAGVRGTITGGMAGSMAVAWAV